MSRELERIARSAMVTYGLEPDFPPAALAQLAATPDDARRHGGADGGLRDLRDLPWSSIDNDDSRDLDQLEVCVGDQDAPARVLIAIADVDALVQKDSPLDRHAALNTTSVYTPAIIFPMLPPALSTDLTSLNQDQDRAAMVIDMTIDGGGAIVASDVYRALVRNKAQLAYHAVADWLEGSGPPPPAMTRVPGLEAQVRRQDAIAARLRDRRADEGALEFARSELKPVVDGDGVSELRTETTNRAKSIIENFMVAANGITVRFLTERGFATIRRIVRSPERWARIVDLASQHGGSLPGSPDAPALQQFLRDRRAAEPDTFQDLSLAIIKLLGRGEYVAESAAEPSAHFALATGTYSHSTAPNRRFPDVVIQRLLKAAIAKRPAPYQLPELRRLADHCTKQEDAANKVERLTGKAAAALWLTPQIGKTFDAIVTGAGPKGTWVRLVPTPVEGRLERGFEGLDVGDRVRVRLVSTDPRRGFIDFARAT
ncbi:MAG TPA: RNB domain-containing ribonuclease [Vicinamibacterales bacterium]|nr:RNB domain-containing ribonuclease [Vicinamibacterales bacterium]